jgi:tetratricopeptide (TPR) repeat protein
MRFEDQDTYTLVRQFEQALSEGRQPYYDVEDLELILEYYLETGSFAQMRSALGLAQEIHPLAFVFKVKEVQLDIATKDYTKAQAKLNHLEGLNMRSAELLIARATILIHQGNNEAGLKILDKAFNDAEDPVDVLQLIIDAHLSQGDYPRSIEALLKWCELEEDALEESALYQLAMCLDFTNEYDRALDIFTSLTTREPYNPLLWYQIGAFYLRKNKEDKALQAFEWATLADENYHPAYFEQGRIHERNERLYDALNAYRQSISEEVPSGYIHFRIGLLELELDAPKEALRQFNTAIALEDDIDDIYLERAGVYMELEQYTEALSDFRRVWLDEAYGEEDVLDYVECLIELDDLDEAIRILYDGIDKFPAALQLRLVLSGYLIAIDELAAAETVLSETLRREPKTLALFAEYFPELPKIPAVGAILASIQRENHD